MPNWLACPKQDLCSSRCACGLCPGVKTTGVEKKYGWNIDPRKTGLPAFPETLLRGSNLVFGFTVGCPEFGSPKVLGAAIIVF